ncbi:hypothetical protein BDV59DRAFT_147521 [Aspergillus ambiguus]|uniref:uncharacterized protein n=1 Tax=Aspergillus ambiguus TaxID=176160 RepID=UPI003CCD1F9C
MKTEDPERPNSSHTVQMSTTRRRVEGGEVYAISCYIALNLMNFTLGERKPGETYHYFFLRFMLIGSITLMGQFFYKRFRGA